MPLSPTSPSGAASPRSLPPNPNLNPFSALSPDLHTKSSIPTTSSEKAKPLITYTRSHLLHVARTSRRLGFRVPAKMSPLSAWFGTFSPPKSQNQMEDPAIASFDPPTSSMSRRTAGGFGEGFGYGGGIGGGKGLGKGGRVTGLRRPSDLPADNSHNATGRTTNKSGGERYMRTMPEDVNKAHERRYKKDEGDWRRPGSGNVGRLSEKHSSNARQSLMEDETIEPAWMDDGLKSPDPAIVQSGDSLVHFIPGEDMIAAHRREMNFRKGDNQFRAEKPLVSFCGNDAYDKTVDTTLKPKVFNSANYLKQSKPAHEADIVDSEASNSTGFQSRFQRFFGGPQQSVQTEEPRERLPLNVVHPMEGSSPSDVKVDDHMARLMGLLSAKPSTPPHPPPRPGADSSNYESDGYTDFSQPHRIPTAAGASRYPVYHNNNYDPRAHYIPSHPYDEESQRLALQQAAYQGPISMPRSVGEDTRLARPPHRPPPPSFNGPLRSPHDLLVQLQQPRPHHISQNMPTVPPLQHNVGMPVPTHFVPPLHPGRFPVAGHQVETPIGNFQAPPPPLNSAQHDMLAALFAGLPKNNG